MRMSLPLQPDEEPQVEETQEDGLPATNERPKSGKMQRAHHLQDRYYSIYSDRNCSSATIITTHCYKNVL
jgi:hypothetical protein